MNTPLDLQDTPHASHVALPRPLRQREATTAAEVASGGVLAPLAPLLVRLGEAAAAGLSVRAPAAVLGVVSRSDSELLAQRALGRLAARTAGHDAQIPATVAAAAFAALAAS